MASVGTLVTDAQVLFFVGENPGANQIIEANVDFAILMAEAQIFLETDTDFVANYSSVDANLKQVLAMATAAKAAMLLINQNQNTWQLATSQSKLNVLDIQYSEAIDRLKKVDL